MSRTTISRSAATVAIAVLQAGTLGATLGETGEDGRTYQPSNHIRQTTTLELSRQGGGLHVALIASAGGDVDSPFYTDVRDFLMDSGEFAGITVMNAGETTPSIAELEQFDAVMVWSNFSFKNSVLLGDNLSRYVDAGGGVVVAAFANSSDTAGRFLEGRWSDNDYELIPAASGNTTGSATLGVIHMPAHPLVDGVSTFAGGSSSFRPTRTLLHPTGILVAEWSDGATLVTVREDTVGSRVDLGFYPPSDHVLPNFWDAATDGDFLLINALKYAATRPPLIPGDSDADGDVDSDDLTVMDACYAIAGDGDAPAGCITFDFDRDDDMDCFDQAAFRTAWTGPAPSPPLSTECSHVVPTLSQWHAFCLVLLVLISASLMMRRRAHSPVP